MRLTENMILARSKQSDLSAIKRINLWGCDLTDISIMRNMTNIEVLVLSINNLSCLQPLEACLKLQILYLRKNNISDFNELRYLQNLPALTELWLAENPCAIRAGLYYRACVVKMLPKLNKLDDVEISAAEIEEAMKLDFNSLNTECFPFEFNLNDVSPRCEHEKIESPKSENKNVQEMIQTQAEPSHEIYNSATAQQNQSPREIQQPLKKDTPELQRNTDYIELPDLPIRAQVPQESESPRSRQSLSLSSTPILEEQPPDSTNLNSSKSLNQIPQLKLVLQINPTQGAIDQPLSIQYPEQKTTQNRYENYNDNRNANAVRPEQQGSVTSRSRLCSGLQQDSGWDSFSPRSREMNSHRFQRNFPLQDGFHTSRSTNTENLCWEHGTPTNRSSPSYTNASTSTQYSSQSSHSTQRNSNVLSALLYIVPELDVEGLQVLEHSIQCRLDELCE